MDTLFASGRIIDAILVLVLLEGLALLAWHRRTGQGPGPTAVIANLGAGALLLLAVRAALADAGWPVAAMLLGAAGLAHLFDLRCRWAAAPHRV